MDSTNEFQDINFEEEENEDESQQTESPTTSSLDRVITIDYYKKLIQSLANRINKIKEKLQHYRKIQLQFSMLLNKTVENQFGPILDEPQIQKQAVPPLPPIHKESRTEIIRLIHNATPSDVSSYFQKSNVISLLLFSDTSVFDNRLKESLMHSSPDIQVSFFNSTFKQIKKCGEFIDQMLPLLSKFSTDSLLRSQIYDINSNYIDFYRNYYLKFIQSISKLVNYTIIKIIYTTQDFSSLIYPTEKYTHIVNYSNSVCNRLFKKKITQMNSPQKDPTFEIVSEGPIFEDYPNVLSVKFNLATPNANSPAGIVLILSDEKFTDVDETNLSVIVDFFSPLLKLFRSLFLHINPSNFSKLTNSVSSLRTCTTVSPSFSDRLCAMCGAQRCRILLTNPNNFFPEIKTAQTAENSQSLILQTVAQCKTASFLNARKNPGFNKAVDDEPSLPKISSMLVTPINGTDFVAALYNSASSSEFTPVQRAMADAFALSLRPLLRQIEDGRRIEAEGERRGKDKVSLLRTIEGVSPIIGCCLDGSLFEYLAKISPSNRFLLFEKISGNEALRFPGSDLVEISDNLAVTDFFRETDQFDINIDVANDSDVKKVLVTSSPRCTVIVTSHEPEFDSEVIDFLKRMSSVLLMVAPFISLQNCLSQCKQSHQLLRDSLRMSAESFSQLISARVELLLFDEPIQSDPDVPGAPLIVSIETARGIEGALVAYDSSNEVKAAVISYAEWLTSSLSQKHIIDDQKNANEQIMSLFVELGILDVFKCSKRALCDWLARVIPILQRPPSCESLIFVRSLLADESISSWFAREDRLLIVLCAFLNGIQKKWECKSDRKTVKKLNTYRSKSCATLAAVFGTGFGIADALNEEEARSIASRMGSFVTGSSVSDASLLLARVRSVSMHGFKQSEASKKWIGAAVAELVRIHRFTLRDDRIAEKLRRDFGEDGMKTELFVAERVLLPIISFLSAKHSKLANLNSAVRESIILARKSLH